MDTISIIKALGFYLAFILVMALYEFFSNRIACKRLIKLKEAFLDHAFKPNLEFNQHTHEIIALFKKANVPDAIIPRVEPLGLGQIATAQYSLFANISRSNDMEFAAGIVRSFEEAIGTYKYRMKQSYSILHWIQVTFLLPQQVAKYFSIPDSNWIVKIFQLIYWGAMIYLGLRAQNLI